MESVAGVASWIAACALALPLVSGADDAEPERDVIYRTHVEAAELVEILNALVRASEPPIRIVADVRSNALVIVSSPEDFAALRDVVGQLDRRRPQVLIESVLLELRASADRALESEPLVEAMREAAPLTGTVLGDSIEVRGWRLAGLTQLPALEASLMLGKMDQGVRIVTAAAVLTADNEEAQIAVDREARIPSGFRWNEPSTFRFTPQIRDAATGEIGLTVEGDEGPFRGGPWTLQEGQALLLGALRGHCPAAPG